MEAQELVGKQLTESDFAIHSRSSGDDLDAKVSRASLDLAHLRAEVDGWQERLGKVRAIMTRYKAQAKAQVSEVLVEMLDDQQPVDDTTVAAVMELGGGV